MLRARVRHFRRALKASLILWSRDIKSAFLAILIMDGIFSVWFGICFLETTLPINNLVRFE